MKKMIIHLKIYTGEKSCKDDKDDNKFENAHWRKANQR